MIEFDWLLFLAQLPATPSSLRVNAWRRLRDAGSTSLQNGVWILPRNPENTLFMERLLATIKQSGASGQIFVVQGLDQAIHEDIITRFKADREQEYDEFLEQCEAFLSELEKETQRQKFTFAELEENEQNLQRLRKWIAKIQKRDFFKTKKSQEAVAAFQNCRQWLQNYTRQVYAQEGIDTPLDVDIISEDAGSVGQEKNNDIE
jgi:vacuolar-type H+-ATPase subunit I/STV1